jgi:hypothetical protein
MYPGVAATRVALLGLHYSPGWVVVADHIVVALAYNPAVLNYNSSEASSCRKQRQTSVSDAR